MNIGFVGLGAMGLPMARRLADAGHRLFAYDVDATALGQADSAGVARAADVAAACADSEVLITCLPRPDIVEQVYAQVNRTGVLACDCSTIPPTLAWRLHAELAARGVAYVECPMLGGAVQAAAGELFLILSGVTEDVERLAPILEVIGRGYRHVGGPGTASLFKVVQNGLGHVQIVAIAEALAILAKAGADLGEWCDVVAAGHGMADTPLFRARAKEMLVAEPEVAGKLRIGAKDIGLAAALAAELGVDAKLFVQADRDYQAAITQGLGETDTASVARAVEARTGVRISD